MRSKNPILWPVLRTVEDVRNLNRIWLDLIDDDVRQRREGKLASPNHPLAHAAKMGKMHQSSATVIDG